MSYPEGAPDALVYRHCPHCTAKLTAQTDPFDGRTRPGCPDCGWIHHANSPIGVLAVIEAPGGLVFTHPAHGTPEAPASLAGLFLDYGESPEEGLTRAVAELTGLHVEILDELTRFQQPGTPLGHAHILGFRTRVTGGDIRTDGAEGPAVLHPRDALPEIIPARLANRRVLAAYLARDAAH
ncbi:NUDIX domain-containing protein [Phytomonospora endophytica]|uniref:NADH pyrophosphatase NudC (Nudix superfamily) n=1 Tax=Phytomonospora endophytica TaxID=714109 RepID=A0A841FDZ6_9ACTN|nr:NUDIX domain-containing protein [Phytomonospora endophytica]MBB6034486.1 NADH pyrophosphatase NudC (nudix superfamily) [Phytomonospora endophytica]GIG70393.1 hypothetical protein Pen01_66880 [Phytomonospora endophytica]